MPPKLTISASKGQKSLFSFFNKSAAPIPPVNNTESQTPCSNYNKENPTTSTIKDQVSDSRTTIHYFFIYLLYCYLFSSFLSLIQRPWI